MEICGLVPWLKYFYTHLMKKKQPILQYQARLEELFQAKCLIHGCNEIADHQRRAPDGFHATQEGLRRDAD